MIKREFKVNFKNFLLWLIILLGMFLVVYLIYPYIITEESMKELDTLMESMPPELLKAFNMDMDSMTTAFGWVKTEGYVYVLLLVGFFSSILGGTILLKEESDKTIEYLESLPVTRNQIITSKIIVGISYILLILIIFFIFNYISLSITGDFNQLQFILMSIAPAFTVLPLFAINLFISTFLHNTKAAIGIGIGIVFISYILSLLSELSKDVEFIKYFSIYTLTDIRNVIQNVEINPILVLISLFITIIFIVLSYIRYNRKELV